MSRLAFGAVAMACAFAATARAATIEVILRDAAGQPVADAAVFAVPAGGATEARGKSVSIEQVDREFVPHVTVLQVGTAASFPNRDPILHHVYSFSPAKPFEIKLYTGRSPGEVVFDKPGVVTLGCNIHDWMTAYVVVVPTPHFGRSDASGQVRLRDLPAGSYELHAWHPQQRAAPATQAMTLEATATSPAQFALELQPRKPKFKPPLDRLKY
jgi:plastocyanin